MFRSLILVLTCATCAWAETISLDLENAGTYAVRRNPSLQAARLRIEEARGRLHQAGRLKNPEVEAEFFQNIRSSERTLEISFVQRFPITSRLRLEKAVSRAEVAAAEAEVADQERLLIRGVRSGAVRLLALEKQRMLRGEQLTVSRDLLAFTRKRVETAEAAPVDVLQIELEGQQLETEILLLESERAALLAELRPQLGLNADDSLVLKGDLSAPTLPRAAGPFARPDLDAARASIAAAQSAAALARAQKWEDVGAGLAIQSERNEDGGEGWEREEFVGVRFSVPLPLWNDNSGRIREADAAAARKLKEAEALSRNIQAEIEAARTEMTTLVKVSETLTGSLLPAAAKVEEQLRAAYAAGQATLADVVRARERRLQLDRQRIDILRDYHLARVRYETAIGWGAGIRVIRRDK